MRPYGHHFRNFSYADGLSFSHVIEQRHESEIHVQLLMAMKQCQTRIVSDEIDLDLLVAAHHHYIFHDSRCRLARHVRQLKAMTV